jgi:hypothetical protein
MTRNARCLAGLLILLCAPLAAILFPTAPVEGMNLAPDFTNLFVAGGVAVLGIGVLVSCFFGSDGADDEIEGQELS